MIRKALIALMFVVAVTGGPAHAGEVRTAAADSVPPAASIDDLAWLAGEWSGEGIMGGAAREVYSPPAGGQIIGHFSQMRGDDMWFYELLSIVPRGNSLVYRLKHFGPDLAGWETQEAESAKEFVLVAQEGDAWYFNGLTIRRDGDKGMVASVRVELDDGKVEELHFRYTRTR